MYSEGRTLFLHFYETLRDKFVAFEKNRQPVFIINSCRDKFAYTIKYLVEKGARLTHEGNPAGRTLLMIAIALENVKLVELCMSNPLIGGSVKAISEGKSVAQLAFERVEKSWGDRVTIADKVFRALGSDLGQAIYVIVKNLKNVKQFELLSSFIHRHSTIDINQKDERGIPLVLTVTMKGDIYLFRNFIQCVNHLDRTDENGYGIFSYCYHYLPEIFEDLVLNKLKTPAFQVSLKDLLGPYLLIKNSQIVPIAILSVMENVCPQLCNKQEQESYVARAKVESGPLQHSLDALDYGVNWLYLRQTAVLNVLSEDQKTVKLTYEWSNRSAFVSEMQELWDSCGDLKNRLLVWIEGNRLDYVTFKNAYFKIVRNIEERASDIAIPKESHSLNEFYERLESKLKDVLILSLKKQTGKQALDIDSSDGIVPMELNSSAASSSVTSSNVSPHSTLEKDSKVEKYDPDHAFALVSNLVEASFKCAGLWVGAVQQRIILMRPMPTDLPSYINYLLSEQRHRFLQTWVRALDSGILESHYYNDYLIHYGEKYAIFSDAGVVDRFPRTDEEREKFERFFVTSNNAQKVLTLIKDSLVKPSPEIENFFNREIVGDWIIETFFQHTKKAEFSLYMPNDDVWRLIKSFMEAGCVSDVMDRLCVHFIAVAKQYSTQGVGPNAENSTTELVVSWGRYHNQLQGVLERTNKSVDARFKELKEVVSTLIETERKAYCASLVYSSEDGTINQKLLLDMLVHFNQLQRNS